MPGDPAAELTAALERFAGRTPAALLPYDQDALDAALAAGRTLGEARPDQPAAPRGRELAAALAGRPGPAPASRAAPASADGVTARCPAVGSDRGTRPGGPGGAR